MIQTPNIKKLIVHKMSLLMISVDTPAGQGLATGIAALTKPGNIGDKAREATAWVEAAIALVKTSPDNPYTSDEEIAGAILKGIEEKKRQRV